MDYIKKYSLGILITIGLAFVGNFISGLIPNHLISGGVFALLIGMCLNPILYKENTAHGFNFVSKTVLKSAIIFMGVTLSYSQIVEVGKFSLIVMTFTLISAFGGGYLLGRLFKMDWKLSSLISAGTGICGGSAVAAISPVIKAKDSDIAYAISATFIFDVIMVILFPIAGRIMGLSDLGYGLWAGTAVNDTSSVVAAGYAFSDAAGNFSIIVKLTRTLSIIPVVLIFSLINNKVEHKKHGEKIAWKRIFPWFIILFLAVIAIKSTGIIPQSAVGVISELSKFFMVMALGAIGLKTNFKSMFSSGFKPMLHGFLVSALVVFVSLGVQLMFGQI